MLDALVKRNLTFWLVFCSAAWGTTFYMSKDVIGNVHPIPMIAYRFLLSAFFMLPAVFRAGRPVIPWKEGGVLSVPLILLYITQMTGLLFTSAANSGFITGLFVLFVPLLGWMLFREKLTAHQWGAVAVALAGLWILTGGISSVNKGDVLTLAAAVTAALHVIAMGWAMKRGADAVLLNFIQLGITGVFCLLLALAAGYPLEIRESGAAWMIVYLALVPTVIAMTIQAVAQKYVSATKAALIFTLEPLFAAVFTWTLGGEAFAASAALGGVLMVAAAAMSEWKPAAAATV